MPQVPVGMGIFVSGWRRVNLLRCRVVQSKTMTRVFTLIITALLTCVANAQPADLAQIRTVVGQSALRQGDHAVLALVFDLREGYHAQSNTPTD
ncbi:MAG: hypothetical protein NZ561_08945, partial [Phycisphaerae bacterium]|nr:hypothetical protein [Phycisphaerae bacterium]MDW8263186.1 hypothetical protein [Phycisphaerales bacterium]